MSLMGQGGQAGCGRGDDAGQSWGTEMYRLSLPIPRQGMADRSRGTSGVLTKHGARRRRLPCLEALESRLVLSALGGSPPVTMLSAAATDSRSVTISYRVNQAASADQLLQ